MKKLRILAAALLISAGLFAQDIPGMTHRVLDNGLELFMLENHNVPLTTVQITFRCGALTQSPETAGLFHLYEHMLFKGNRTFPTQTEFMAAMKSLGVGNWNGGTSTEYVTYYFTIPSSKTAEGVAFWSEAVRYPLFEESELEIEKGVVINEIKGYHNDPQDNFRQAISGRLFYEYPWRRDISGPVDVVQNCTVEQLKTMQETFYTPDNCALFVAGDIDPALVEAEVERLMGDWERNPEPFTIENPHPFMEENDRLVFQEPSMYPGFAKIGLYMRGPDVLDDPEATYAADVLLTLLEDPESRFRQSIFAKVPGLYGPEYINKIYYTQKDGGQIIFGTYGVVQGEADPYAMAEQFKEAVLEEIQVMINDPDYFAAEDYDVMKNVLEDQMLISMEVPSSFISQFSFWWASASTDYFLGYIDNMKNVDHEKIASYLKSYVSEKPWLLTVEMNPDLYAQHPAADNFEEIVRESAYW
ncbi:MAG: pitrilysin family protein, partial [Spirochaetales bacterium]|nr:pitrilysin family protein [Spirochaetales bacterium]